MTKYVIPAVVLNPYVFAAVSSILGFGVALALLGEYQYFPVLLECLEAKREYFYFINRLAEFEWEVKSAQTEKIHIFYYNMMVEERGLMIDNLVSKLQSLRSSEAKFEGSKLVHRFYTTLPPQWREEGSDNPICPSLVLAKKWYPHLWE